MEKQRGVVNREANEREWEKKGVRCKRHRDVYGFRALETGVFSEVGVEKEEAVIWERRKGASEEEDECGEQENRRERGSTVLWTADPAIVGIMKPRRDFSLFSCAVKRYLEWLIVRSSLWLAGSHVAYRREVTLLRETTEGPNDMSAVISIAQRLLSLEGRVN